MRGNAALLGNAPLPVFCARSENRAEQRTSDRYLRKGAPNYFGAQRRTFWDWRMQLLSPIPSWEHKPMFGARSQ